MHYFLTIIFALSLFTFVNAASYSTDAYGSGTYPGTPPSPAAVSVSPTSGGGGGDGDIITATSSLTVATTTAAATTTVGIKTATATSSFTGIFFPVFQHGISSSTPFLNKTIFFGAKNEEIRKLQEFLSKHPDIYPSKLVTGFFGSSTKSAIIKFQAKHNLPTTGFVGPLTIKKLNELEGLGPEEKPAEEKVKSLEAVKEEITTLQHSLIELLKKKLEELKARVVVF